MWMDAVAETASKCYRGEPWVLTVEHAYDINKAEEICQTMMKRAVRIIVWIGQYPFCFFFFFFLLFFWRSTGV